MNAPAPITEEDIRNLAAAGGPASHPYFIGIRQMRSNTKYFIYENDNRRRIHLRSNTVIARASHRQNPA